MILVNGGELRIFMGPAARNTAAMSFFFPWISSRPGIHYPNTMMPPLTPIVVKIFAPVLGKSCAQLYLDPLEMVEIAHYNKYFTEYHQFTTRTK